MNLRIGSATYERTTVNQTVFGLAHRQTSPASIARRFANDPRSVVKFDVALRTWPRMSDRKLTNTARSAPLTWLSDLAQLNGFGKRCSRADAESERSIG